MMPPVAQSPDAIQQSAHDAGEREGVPEERRADNPGLTTEGAHHPVDSVDACVLASAPGGIIALAPWLRELFLAGQVAGLKEREVIG